MIVVCDNTDIAEMFYEKISGESEMELVTPEDIEESLERQTRAEMVRKNGKIKRRTSYGNSSVLAELANIPARKHTIRIDTKLLAEAESEDPKKRATDGGRASPGRGDCRKQGSPANTCGVWFRSRC